MEAYISKLTYREKVELEQFLYPPEKVKPKEQSGLVEQEPSESISYYQKSQKKPKVDGDRRSKRGKKDEGLAKAVLLKMMTNMNVDEEFLVSISFDL